LGLRAVLGDFAANRRARFPELTDGDDLVEEVAAERLAGVDRVAGEVHAAARRGATSRARAW
jgi:hypothetical protein